MTTTITDGRSYYPISLKDDGNVQFLISANQPNPDGKLALMTQAEIYFVYEYTAYRLQSGTDLSGLILRLAQRLLAHKPYDTPHDVLSLMALGITVSEQEAVFSTYARAYRLIKRM